MRNKRVSTSIKKILRAFITKFPDFSLTFLHSKIFPDFSQNSLTFPWPWKIKFFPDFSLTAGNPADAPYLLMLTTTFFWVSESESERSLCWLLHFNRKVIRMTALVITGDAWDKLQCPQWRLGQLPRLLFHFVFTLSVDTFKGKVLITCDNSTDDEVASVKMIPFRHAIYIVCRRKFHVPFFVPNLPYNSSDNLSRGLLLVLVIRSPTLPAIQNISHITHHHTYSRQVLVIWNLPLGMKYIYKTLELLFQIRILVRKIFKETNKISTDGNVTVDELQKVTNLMQDK